MGSGIIAESVAIIGGGFSGTLLAVNLARHDGPKAVLIERCGEAGRGLAYAAHNGDHLLNVRAGNMSALPDEPDHFVRWLDRHGFGDRLAFAPRRAYGEYLSELLAETRAHAPHRIVVVHDDVLRLRSEAGGVAISFEKGPELLADQAVLALGNLPPHSPAGVDPAVLDADHYVTDPWTPDIAAGLGDTDTILLIGSGLTATDVVMSLVTSGSGCRIIILSRRGLLPRPHGGSSAAHEPVSADALPPLGSKLLHRVRERADMIGWRGAIDELRPITQAIWVGANNRQRARVLRHLRPYWDVHRHRLPPQIWQQLEDMYRSARLKLLAGRLRNAVLTADGVSVEWQPAHQNHSERIHVRRIVNCTGPLGNLLQTREPLLVDLLTAGAVRPDGCQLGLDVDAQARVVRADGSVDQRLHAVGPMTRGAFWEVTAVPDIRRQVWNLARRMSNAHWVGGEGL